MSALIPQQAFYRLMAFSMPLIGLFVFSGSALANTESEFKPQDEFKLDPWVEIQIGPLDMSINKAVMMLILAGIATVVTVMLFSRKAKLRDAGRLQTAVEMGYNKAYRDITQGNIENDALAKKWFGFLATLFLFLWYSNMLGFIPLPTNTEHTFSLFGANIPSFGIYAATANISVTLALALIVWFGYHYEGIREKGLVGYFKGWIPTGTPKAVMPLVVPVEILSQFVRLISLTARLFANMLAGHILILMMGGGLVILTGSVFVGATSFIAALFYVLEIGLIAWLQAFIFATLSAMYLGGAVAHEH